MKFISGMRADLIFYIRKYGMETIINSQKKILAGFGEVLMLASVPTAQL